MPQARKSTRSSSRRGSSYKQPAALKRLNSSLDAAQKALTDLRKHTSGREAADTTKSLYKGLGKFVSDARKDTGKFTTALKKDFDAAAKSAQSAAAGARGGRSTKTSSSRSSSGSRSSSSSRSSGTRRTGTSRSTRKSS